MITESDNAEFYDQDSSSYDQQRWTTAAGRFTNRVQQRILDRACADWTDGRVLEIGPGTARFSIPMSRKGNRLTLLDLSTGMLDVARGNMEAAGLGDQIEAYVQGSVYELPFEASEFDHVYCLNVLNHLEYADQAIVEMARVLKPGSTLLFNYANLHSYYWPVGRRINQRSKAVGRDVYSKWETPSVVRRAIRDAGLTLVRRMGHVHIPRGLERIPVHPIIMVLDACSRRAPLSGLAPIHFCLCRKPS